MEPLRFDLKPNATQVKERLPSYSPEKAARQAACMTTLMGMDSALVEMPAVWARSATAPPKIQEYHIVIHGCTVTSKSRGRNWKIERCEGSWDGHLATVDRIGVDGNERIWKTIHNTWWRELPLVFREKLRGMRPKRASSIPFVASEREQARIRTVIRLEPAVPQGFSRICVSLSTLRAPLDLL